MHIDEQPADRPDAFVCLPLERFTAKVGAGFRQYPRAGGVLVPLALVGLTSVPAPDVLPAAQAARLRLGRAVVSQVRRVMRRMPAEVLTLPLPPPSRIIGQSRIEHRTRNVVERLIPFETTRPWSVARYLQVAGFGPRCLTDLLAASEESARTAERRGATDADLRADAAVADTSLVELARRLRPSLPLTSAELTARFPDEPFARASDPLRALARAYQAAGIGAPFRVVRRGGRTIAVAPDSSGVERVACEEASRQVAGWGLSDVDQVAARVEHLSASPVAATIVRRVLVALPRLRWLDARMSWFSFVGERSRLGRAVERLCAGAEAVRLDALLGALAVGSISARRVPAPVLTRYLTEIASCDIVDGLVRRRG